MKLISYEEALQEALKDPEFNIEYKKICYQVDIVITIYNVRKGQKLTQKQFAKKYNISLKKLKKIEDGDFENITLGFLENLFKKLELYMSIKIKNFSEDLDFNE